MKVEQRAWTEATGWTSREANGAAQLVLVFGGREVLDAARVNELAAMYPKAHIMGCSTAGEIAGTIVSDRSLCVSACQFASSTIEVAQVDVSQCPDSATCGERLASALPAKGLVHVFVLSDGTTVNGSELVRGLMRRLPRGVAVTGGLSADGDRFKQTLVFCDQPPASRLVVAVGFYGPRLKIGYGSLGGWDSFGPERTVTRSKGNILYELDEQPALALYKQYLGEHAKGLPSTGLLFPLSVRTRRDGPEVVRTILGVDEATQSMTFAGDVPQGGYARLMKANFDRLVDGAQGAAKTSYAALGSASPELAILISCVGRRLVLKQRTEEELEAVQQVLGPKVALTGFYSYGEICPAAPQADCELHNQTMTITTFSES